MRFCFGIALILIFNRCSTGVELKPVPLGSLFHDSNSKVWLIEQVRVGGKDYSPSQKMDKDVIIFYKSGKCLFQPMKTLGDFVGKRGEFAVYSGEKTITIYFKNEKWDFSMSSIEEDQIILSPKKDSDLKYELVLIPFPEL